MPEPAVISLHTSRTGGFRIESTAATLDVARDPKAREDENQSLIQKIMRRLLLIMVGLVLIGNLFFAISSGRFASALPFGALLLFAGYFIITRSVITASDIHCTHETLQVIQVQRGRQKSSWTFPKEQVGPISYAVFSSSRYGSTCGLQFLVQDERVRVLSGLEIVEAQYLLNELSRLGYQVVNNVAMPMAVEIAKERRNSIFH